MNLGAAVEPVNIDLLNRRGLRRARGVGRIHPKMPAPRGSIVVSDGVEAPTVRVPTWVGL
jgi:hypothetical protein